MYDYIDGVSGYNVKLTGDEIWRINISAVIILPLHRVEIMDHTLRRTRTGEHDISGDDHILTRQTVGMQRVGIGDGLMGIGIHLTDICHPLFGGGTVLRLHGQTTQQEQQNKAEYFLTHRHIIYRKRV